MRSFKGGHGLWLGAFRFLCHIYITKPFKFHHRARKRDDTKLGLTSVPLSLAGLSVPYWTNKYRLHKKNGAGRVLNELREINAANGSRVEDDRWCMHDDSDSDLGCWILRITWQRPRGRTRTITASLNQAQLSIEEIRRTKWGPNWTSKHTISPLCDSATWSLLS